MFYFTYLNYYYFHCKITALQLCRLNVVILHVLEGEAPGIGRTISDRRIGMEIFMFSWEGAHSLQEGVSYTVFFMRVTWGKSH